eukprot:377584-Pyramimonas_sp.AAC.1
MRYRAVARGSVAQKDKTIADLLQLCSELVGAFALRSRGSAGRTLAGGEEARGWVDIRRELSSA